MDSKSTKKMIKELIDDALAKHETNVRTFIAANTTLIQDSLSEMRKSIESLTTRIGKIETTVKEHDGKINEIERSIEFTQNLLDDKTAEMDRQIDQKLRLEVRNLNNCIYTSNKQLDFYKEKLRVLEDRNRRNNLRVDGIKENANESWEESEAKIEDFLKTTMKIEQDILIERAHRMGKKDRERPRTIIFKLQSWKDKEIILKNSNKLKNTGFFINEDYSDETMAIRKNLFKDMKKERDNGKFARVIYDKLIVRDFRPAR
eukprot:TCONS_00034738-protein